MEDPSEGRFLSRYQCPEILPGFLRLGEEIMKDQTEKTLLEKRKQRRKEKRSEKRQNQFLSWVEHQKSKHKSNVISNSKPPEKQAVDKGIENKITTANASSSTSDSVKKEKRKISKKMPKKTKFQEFLEMEAHEDVEDLEMERKLAKKLKVKGGKLGGFDDGINDLFDGIPSVLETNSLDDETLLTETTEKSLKLGSSRKKRKRKQVSPTQLTGNQFSVDASSTKTRVPDEVTEKSLVSTEISPLELKSPVEISKYVAPHLRACSQNESEELSSIRRRIRGLLNRLSESNVESITAEVASISRATARRNGCQITCEEICHHAPMDLVEMNNMLLFLQPLLLVWPV